MSYLVVTTLDFAGADRISVERDLAALGLLNCLVDSRNEAHELPQDTYAGVFDGPTARMLHRRFADEVRAVLSPHTDARAFVSVGGHWSLRHAA